MAETRYWLMKSEPDVFSLSDLERAPGRTTGWEGVRNYQARNYLRDQFKTGDRVLFYHSRVEPIGIQGVAEVVREAYPDPTAFDPSSRYFDPKSKVASPTWLQVDVRFVCAFPAPISLAQLKQTPGLERMMVVQKGSRLSVQPVSIEEWGIVLALAGVSLS